MDFDIFNLELKQLLLIIHPIFETTKFSVTISVCLYSFSLMSWFFFIYPNIFTNPQSIAKAFHTHCNQWNDKATIQATVNNLRHIVTSFKVIFGQYLLKTQLIFCWISWNLSLLASANLLGWVHVSLPKHLSRNQLLLTAQYHPFSHLCWEPLNSLWFFPVFATFSLKQKSIRLF